MLSDRSSVLIDQTMLCEAARLMRDARPWRPDYEERRWPPSISEQLFHLSTILDALLLYDQLYVLPAELPEDAPKLSLRNRLIDSGIIANLDTAPIADDVGEELRVFLSEVGSSRPKIDEEKEQVAKEIAQIASRLLVSKEPTLLPSIEATVSPVDNWTEYREEERQREAAIIEQGLRGQQEGTLSHSWLRESRRELQENPIATVGRHLMDKIGYFNSGAYVSGISHLRTFVYWRVSDRLGLPFFPSCRRMPQIMSFDRQLRRSLPHELFQVIAKSFKASIEDVYDDLSNEVISLPPFLALYLDKVRAGHDRIDAFFELREEFRELRSAITDLQNQLCSSQSLRARVDAKRRFNRLVTSLTRHYDLKHVFFLEEAVAFAPDILKPLGNPFDPGKYSTSLIQKPVEWIRDWWQHRPFKIAYELRSKLLDLPEYEKLAQSALGISLDSKAKLDFIRYYDDYMTLYGVVAAKQGA